MSAPDVDRITALKASLELMVAENGEIHEHFRSLVGKLGELEALPAPKRREQFQDMVEHGDFQFQGIDVRHFAQTQTRPLPPPVFLSRTRRRLENTNTLLDAFVNRGLFEQGHELREEIDALTFEAVNEESSKEVVAFKEKVEALRNAPVFQQYLDVKQTFIRQDSELRAEADFIATKESVEEGEETFRQRDADLNDLSRKLENEEIGVDEAEERLAQLSLDSETDPGASASPGHTDQGEEDARLDEAFAESLAGADAPSETGDDAATVESADTESKDDEPTEIAPSETAGDLTSSLAD